MEKLHRAISRLHFCRTSRAFSSASASCDQNANPLHARKMPHDLAVYPWNRRELARPVGRLVRPREPSGFVLLPLRRHAETGLAARIVTSGQPALRDRSIGVNPAVAQETASCAALRPSAWDRTRRSAPARLCRLACAMTRPNGSDDKRIAPELQSVFRRTFESDAVHCRDEDAIRNRMGTLNCSPGIQLRFAILRFFRRDASRSQSDKTTHSRPASCVMRAPSGYH